LEINIEKIDFAAGYIGYSNRKMSSTTKKAAKSIAKVLVLVTLGPILVGLAPIAIVTSCLWERDSSGCPRPPPFVKVPLKFVFDPWK
jgi:hypothetical protein